MAMEQLWGSKSACNVTCHWNDFICLPESGWHLSPVECMTNSGGIKEGVKFLNNNVQNQ